MRNRGHMEDLLRDRRRRRAWRKYAQFAALAAVVGLAGYIWFVRYDSGSAARTAPKRAVQNVRTRLHESIEAARRPLRIDEAGGVTSKEEARTAEWREGDPVTLRGVLSKNQSVFRALEARGVPGDSIQPVIDATAEEFDFEESRPGDEWYAEVDASGTITRFRYQTSPEDIWETVRNSNDTYASTKIDVPVERRRVTLAGTVDGSLWQAISDVAKKPKLVYRFADIFAYSIDFNRETKPGDQFAMIVEEVYLEGRFLRYGRVLAAEYVNKGDAFRGFLYRPEEGKGGGYYNAKGENLKRQFLKSPLASIRVTSRFGMRYHPVEGRKKMHRGVDYGAPTGTDVRAVADGTVEFAGYKGPNGKLVALDHANGYVTLYAHLSEIADRVEPGAKVTRKTVIGEVGNTGRSTGSHLHFGMKKNGKYVDPMEVEFARAEPLEGEELKKFRTEVVKPMTEQLREAKRKSDAVNLAESQVESGDEG